MAIKNPEYTIIRRRDDEDGNPRYSAIDFAESKDSANKKACKKRKDNRYGDILFFLKTDNVSNLPNENFEVYVADKMMELKYAQRMDCLQPWIRRERNSWIAEWEGVDVMADNMINTIYETCGVKATILVLCKIGRTLGFGDEFNKFLLAAEAWANNKSSKPSAVDLAKVENLHGVNFSYFYNYSNIYAIFVSMRNAITEEDFSYSHCRDAVRFMSLNIDPHDYKVGYLRFAGIVREAMPLKDILLRMVNENAECTWRGKFR